MNKWKIDNYPYTNGAIIVIDDCGECILIFRNPTEANLRNARIIASAPAMLEALIDCQKALEFSGNTKELEIVKNAIRQAI